MIYPQPMIVHLFYASPLPMSRLVSWLVHCTAVLLCLSACQQTSVNPSGPGSATGVGGSMARFAVTDEHLYIVDDMRLSVYQLNDPLQPAFVQKTDVGQFVETIFPFQNRLLFIGTSSGIHLYDISQNPAAPLRLSGFDHAMACDPVVAHDTWAYYTLRTARPNGSARCLRPGNTNLLGILRINDPRQPVLAGSIPMTAPQGLGTDHHLLFVCDQGTLKVYDTRTAPQLALRRTIASDAFDVIPGQGRLIAIAPRALYQYAYDTATFVVEPLSTLAY